jgi:uroporphyrin-III C-methyltransferase
MNGKVYLVGAGPGDPELLTLKALRVLKSADAILHDDLISPEILQLAPVSAQMYNVGKRYGEKKITQLEISFLMLTLAGSGLQVVRLKSGDPLVFGRAGEEIEELRKADIDYEIVPGVTSAFGAAAATGIPLTHRNIASSLIMVTARQASNNNRDDWRRVISSGATLAIYMPGQDYLSLSTELQAAGLSVDTPCAIVSQATTPRQRTAVSTLAQLPNQAQLPSPTLLIVGEVVRLSEPWITQNSTEAWRGLDVLSPFTQVKASSRTEASWQTPEERIS